MTTDTLWQILRSDIYIRDKGMCWICNTFVPLDDYELGHIIDRCNGGHDDYDNLVVMHKDCNRSKPYHQTLEEAVRWKLTAFMPAIQQSRGIASRLLEVNYPSAKRQPIRNYPKLEINYTNPSRTPKQQELYDEQVRRIKPSTICWKQGNPQGKGKNFAPMYRLLPPPYRQKDMFTMRETPLGYVESKIDGKGSIRESLQVIGGELPHDVDINLGFIQIHISPTNGYLGITFTSGVRANNGDPSQTIGMGKTQIPIEAWEEAKAQGISLESFKSRYTNKGNLAQRIARRFKFTPTPNTSHNPRHIYPDDFT